MYEAVFNLIELVLAIVQIILIIKILKDNKLDKSVKFTLKGARGLKGLKQSEVANLLGISTETLGNYERGKSHPDIPVLRKIEKLYGVS